MKRIPLLILLLQVLLTAPAQNKFVISGEVKDETGQPLQEQVFYLAITAWGQLLTAPGTFS